MTPADRRFGGLAGQLAAGNPSHGRLHTQLLAAQDVVRHGGYGGGWARRDAAADEWNRLQALHAALDHTHGHEAWDLRPLAPAGLGAGR